MNGTHANAVEPGLFTRLRLRHVVLLAMVLRLAWMVAVQVRPVSDALAYDMLARQIAAGHGYRWPGGAATAYWPVGTSALYGGLYRIVGPSLQSVAVCNAALGAALVALTYALGRLRFGQAVAIGAALAMAIWPTWIAFTSVMSSELPSNVLFVAGVVCAFGRHGSALSRTVAAAACLTGAAYFRATMLPFVVLVPLFAAAVRERSLRATISHGLIALVVAGLLIAPWACRNDRVLGSPAPISTNFGVNLWIGNNPAANGGFQDAPIPAGATLPPGEVAQDRFYRDAATAFIVAHPGRYAQLSFRRVILTFDRETFGVGWNEQGLAEWAKLPLKLAMTGYWYLVLAAGLGGLAIFIRSDPLNAFSPLVLVPAATLAASILVMGSERYHYAIAPFVAVFAAYAVDRLILARRRGPQTSELLTG